MMIRAGLTTATVAWAAAIPLAAEHDPKGAVAGFAFAWIGSILPDLDHRGSTGGRLLGERTQRLIRWVAGGHRMGTHSLLGVWVAWSLVRFFLESTQGHTVANAMAVGVLSHMFTDILTVQGIGWLWPFGYPFLWTARWLAPSRRARPLVKALARLGRALNAKTRVGWITTGSEFERRYVVAVKCLGLAVACAYLVVWVPRGYVIAETWITTNIGGLT